MKNLKSESLTFKQFLQLEEATSGGERVWHVAILNNYYNGKYADYSARYYPVLASSPEEAKQVVLDNAEFVLRHLLSQKLTSGRRVLPPSSALDITSKRIGNVKEGTRTSLGPVKMLSPRGLVSVKLKDGLVVDDTDTLPVSEGIADAISYRLDRQHPEVFTRYGVEVVADAINDVADFHAGAEELGSSDISIMVNQVLKQLEQYQDRE